MSLLSDGRRNPVVDFLIPSLTIAGATVLTIGLWQRDHLVVEENNLVEWAQVAVLFLAALLHAVGIRREADPPGRTIRFGMTVLCLSLIVREVDIDLLWRPEIMGPVETVVRGIVVAVWIFVLWLVCRSFGAIWRARRALAFSRFSIVTGLGCLCYLASRPFDKNQFELEHDLRVLIEETLQLSATISLVFGALASLPPIPARPTKDAHAPDTLA